MSLRWVVDLDRCTGCSACRIACGTENGLPPGMAWRRVHTFNAELHPDLGRHHLSLACNHCATPACLAGCPARAYHRDPDTGAVLLDPDHCMGCSYCSWVCPFGAPAMDLDRGVMGKCTLCSDRLRRSLQPACVLACPVAALSLEEAADDDPGDPRMAGFPPTPLRPSIRFAPRRNHQRPPRMVRAHAATLRERAPRAADLVRGLAGEWSLLLFTLTAAVLVAWFAAALVGGSAPPAQFFVAAGLAAMAASALHLKNPRNLYRAAANLGSSWVSREVVLFSGFFGLASLQLILGPWPAPVAWLTAMAGFASLAAADMVYRVRGQEVTAFPHSAMVSFTAVLALGLLAHVELLVFAVAALKLLLYLARTLPLVRHEGPSTAWVIRVAAGFVLPVLSWSLGADLLHPVAVAGVLIGELVDRAELYGELRFLDPALQIARDETDQKSVG